MQDIAPLKIITHTGKILQLQFSISNIFFREKGMIISHTLDDGKVYLKV